MIGHPAAGGSVPSNRQHPGPSDRSQRALDWLNFFVADVETAFGPFVALYLARMGWAQGSIGTAIAINSIVALLVQVPAGWLIDHLHRKRLVLAIGIASIGAASLIVGFFPSVPPVAAAEALYGSAGGTIRTAIAAVSLGLVGHRRLHTRTGRNHRHLSFGNALTAACMGALGHFGSPRSPFFAATGLCLPAMIALALIRGCEVDYGRARQSTGREVAGAARWREMFSNRPLQIFAFSLLLFQFANASMLPLASERLATDHKGMSELVTSGFVVVPQVVTALLAAWLARKADEAGRKKLLIAAYLALFARSVLFAIDLGPWYLVSVQVLGGITASVIGIIVPLVVADLTSRSGRYNISLGAVGMIGGIGAALSTVSTGWIAQRFGYLASFLLLAAVTAAGTALLWAMFPETAETTKASDDGG